MIPERKRLFPLVMLCLLLATANVAATLMDSSVSLTSFGAISIPGLIVANFENSTHFLVGENATIWTSQATRWALEEDEYAWARIFQPTTEVVHSGLQAANLTTLDPSGPARRIEILRDINSSELTDIWLQAWYYIPIGTTIDSWMSIHRAIYERLWNTSGIHTYEMFQSGVGIYIDGRIGRPTYGKPILTTCVCKGQVDNDYDGENDLEGMGYTLEGDFEVPFGEWFRITTFVHRHMTNGTYRVWFNGQLIWDLNPVRTIGILPERINEFYHAPGQDDAYACIGFSLYTEIGNPPVSLFVDDILILNSSQTSLTP